jgi:hypothetical protein
MGLCGTKKRPKSYSKLGPKRRRVRTKGVEGVSLDRWESDGT